MLSYWLKIDTSLPFWMMDLYIALIVMKCNYMMTVFYTLQKNIFGYLQEQPKFVLMLFYFELTYQNEEKYQELKLCCITVYCKLSLK